MTTGRFGLKHLIIIFLATLSNSPVRAEFVTIDTGPPGLKVIVDGTEHTSPVVFEWGAGSLHTLDVLTPQLSDDGHTRYLFEDWSDGGLQSHSITVPGSDETITATFVTQYLLETTISPAAAGTLTNDPVGPWYEAGQSVSLTVVTNQGYRFNFWEGIDSATDDVAQVTMDGYRAVTLNFLPSDYPYLVITNTAGAAPGNLVGNIDGRTADGTKLYYVVLDNTGTKATVANKTNTLSRFVTPQGFNAVSGGGAFNFKDENLDVVASYTTLGYTLDAHDVKLLPNGHALLFGTEVRTIDMSELVAGGKPAASVTGNVIQEIDARKRLVFEWHTFDHIPITNSFYALTQQSIDYAHINAVTIDPTDNNLLASLRTTSEIVKISRQTGEIMWRLGGKENQFTFIGEHEENAPFYTVGQHDVHRLANGNLLFFDNGNISGGGVTPNDRNYSRGVEYQLDEANMTATLVWEFRHTPDISAPCTGSIERLPNGNTLIGWGCATPTSGTIVTEVSPAGDVVLEISHRTPPRTSSLMLGNGLTKAFWDSPDLVHSTEFDDIATGQTYAAEIPGVAITVKDLSANAGNLLRVERHLEAVRLPQFSGKSPQVVMEHIVLTGSNITTLEADLELDLPNSGYVFDTPMIGDPEQVVVYQRAIPGQGQFSPLPTSYDPGAQKLKVTTTQTGEFIFAYPDLPEVPSVPALLSPVDGSEVNQAAAVTLTWVPQGLVGSFDLQVATDSDFLNPILDTNDLGSSSFVLQNLLPTTQYFWRVRTVNQGGMSDWASGTFATVPPLLHLTYPAGGEVWQRFQVVTIRWTDNLAENVALDIYKGGEFNRTFVTSTPSVGTYTWTVGQFQAFAPGSDYTIKIRSTTNPDLFEFSNPFSMITNLTSVTIDSGTLNTLPDGRVQFGFSIPGALEATVMGSTNLLDWEALQTVTLTNGNAFFTDDAATNYSKRFYQLRVP